MSDETDILQLIDERDASEEALSQAYFLITGRSPEWSNLFGHDEALEEIDDAQKVLRVEAQSLRERIEELERELSHVDGALARRPAVADAPNRYTAICAAFNMASRTDAAEKMAKHWEMCYGIQKNRADKLEKEAKRD